MTAQTLDSPATKIALSAVLCGSFHRDPAGLAKAHEHLARRFTLLSPRAVGFVDATADFVRLPDEMGKAVDTIEGQHLEAVVKADFVWLHAPDGYVGTSAAMEIGHARALGIPVFTDTAPSDETLRGYVTVVVDPDEVAPVLTAAPGQGLAGLQQYYRRISERRGWEDETAQNTLLLLTEELGELARAVRKTTGLRRDGAYPPSAVEHEIADVQLYLVHLANTLGINIATAVTEKENLNAQRFDAAGRAEVA
jgi:NTP pyrophosphatase (non-canonical NTP hydrolase)